MKLNTASSAISFSGNLEDDSARLYESLMTKYPEGSEVFLSLIRENRHNKTSVERAYYSVISDALEGCFSFEGIETDDFLIPTGLAQGASYYDALNMAIVMEENITKFYLAAAEDRDRSWRMSQGLLKRSPRRERNVLIS